MTACLKTVNIKSSEVFVTAKLETQDKVVCGEYSATAAKSSAFVLDILITRKCSLPSVTVTLTDKAGKVLDTLTTVVVTDGKEKTSTFTKINPTYAGVGALLLIVIALSSYIIYRKRTGQIIG